MLLQFLLVGVGGFCGSVMRFGVSILSKAAFPHHNWPTATFAINVLGCFFIGLVFPLLRSSDPNTESIKLFVMVGILGGFTTFSSFGLETLQLWQNGHTTAAALYVILSVLLGLAFVTLGYVLAGGRL